VYAVKQEWTGPLSVLWCKFLFKREVVGNECLLVCHHTFLRVMPTWTTLHS